MMDSSSEYYLNNTTFGLTMLVVKLYSYHIICYNIDKLFL